MNDERKWLIILSIIVVILIIVVSFIATKEYSTPPSVPTTTFSYVYFVGLTAESGTTWRPAAVSTMSGSYCFELEIVNVTRTWVENCYTNGKAFTTTTWNYLDCPENLATKLGCANLNQTTG